MNSLEAIALTTTLVVSGLDVAFAGGRKMVLTPPAGLCTTAPLAPRLITAFPGNAIGAPPWLMVCDTMTSTEAPAVAVTAMLRLYLLPMPGQKSGVRRLRQSRPSIAAPTPLPQCSRRLLYLLAIRLPHLNLRVVHL